MTARRHEVFDTIKLSGVTLDYPDARQLAAYCAAITAVTVTLANSDHCSAVTDPAGNAFCLATWGKPG